MPDVLSKSQLEIFGMNELVNSTCKACKVAFNMVRVKVQESDGGCCEDGSYVMSKIRLNFVSPEARSD